MGDDRVIRIWTRVAEEAHGTPVSVAHVCSAAVRTVGVDGAGVSVVVNANLRETMHATDGVAAQLEELQLTLGQGPCVDTFNQRGPVLAADLGEAQYATRWPAFTSAAMDRGARAIFALPLQIGVIRLGAMDLYRTRPGALSSGELSDALAFAETAGMLLLDSAAGLLPDTAELVWQRDEPTSHQAQVHQATGMIIAQLNVNADTAFARLRAYAFANERTLADVARDVVERRLRFDPDPPAPEGRE